MHSLERNVRGGDVEERDTAREVRAVTTAGLAAWTAQLGSPAPEAKRSRRMARIGGIAAIAALLLYLIWRIAFTMPLGGWNSGVAWTLVIFEALPLGGLVLKAITLWNIDGRAPEPVTEAPNGMRVALLIPTYNEPVEVLAPTVAAACALQPAHETWVLDDGDRPWVAELCASLGARCVTRAEHGHAKAGNMNHALDLMAAEEAAGRPAIDVIAVLDCDHVPLPTFLTATLGWFAQEDIALVQGPQAFYNSGAFDDDGISGEQGLFFNVQMPARNVAGAGPFWCGSTSLLRVRALREVGGVATETITEDMHTTLKLIRAGWTTVYHHQTLAVGLAPATADQYLLQRRRWGMGAMQILTHERLWAAKSWLSWRNFHEYLNGTLWWLEGAGTLVAFIIPVLVMASGAQTSTAGPLEFALAFAAMFFIRLWGSKRLMRHQIHWPTAFALRIFRVPIGLACLWWLVSRKSLEFQVTPKGAAEERLRGRAPRLLIVLIVVVAAVMLYAAAGVLGWVPWRTSPGSTVASGVWLLLAGVVLVLGTLRIRAAEFATSRRSAHRVAIAVPVTVDGVPGQLVDISMGGAAVTLASGSLPDTGSVLLELPGVEPLPLDIVRMRPAPGGVRNASLRVRDGDWEAYRSLSLWLFHTPPNVLPGFPPGVPAIASREST
ncbi:glycosyltransferase family 2 protein [Arthrobacter sp. CJ23]|uniref:glycosyltransferase family 2 protein n=1 Tax=Arthrobacter sp. CJ23 TaxID=2972479 RepID=UPI00215C5EA0|nr:glycosyltransferase [Arthrobacter sp. CJ23]UVJ40432.1 glycosyltransferase [Arthrobacter sp. CJ23]